MFKNLILILTQADGGVHTTTTKHNPYRWDHFFPAASRIETLTAIQNPSEFTGRHVWHIYRWLSFISVDAFIDIAIVTVIVLVIGVDGALKLRDSETGREKGVCLHRWSQQTAASAPKNR